MVFLRWGGAALALACLLAAAPACKASTEPVDASGRRVLRLGYMPNLTHAPALLGMATGLFAEALGSEVVLAPKVFVAGPSIVEATFAGELDVAYVGPNPAINAFVISNGHGLRIICGATSGGAQFVVRPEIRKPMDLADQKVASPAIANTQDISLRTWLAAQGLATKGGGERVSVIPIAPSETLRIFRMGQIAGAWAPEPWASRLVLEGGGVVLVDERDLWPGGVFPTTVLVASLPSLEARPALVQAFVRAHQEAVRRLHEDPEGSRAAIARYLGEVAKLPIPPEALSRAFTRMDFTTDPMDSALSTLADRAMRLGYLRPGASIQGLVDDRCAGGGPP